MDLTQKFAGLYFSSLVCLLILIIRNSENECGEYRLVAVNGFLIPVFLMGSGYAMYTHSSSGFRSITAMIMLVLFTFSIYYILFLNLWVINGCKSMSLSVNPEQEFSETENDDMKGVELGYSAIILVIVYSGIKELILV